jgi:hypothetical protein
MKANELRIGNWFRYQTKIGYDYDVFDTKYIQDLVNDPQDDFFEPIPLTEDILLKCGFELDLNFKIGTIKINFYNDIKEMVFYFNYNNMILRIKHLHRLQNLYFALTGEELTIKL